MKKESMRQAFADYQSGDLDAALSLCNRFIASDQNAAQALLLSAMIAQQRGQFEQSISLLRNAVDADPHEPVAYKRLAMSLQMLGRPDEAIAELKTAVARAPERADAWNNLAKFLATVGQNDAAIRVQKEYSELRSRVAAIDARFVEACRLLRAGNFADGLKAFESRLEAPDFSRLVDMPCPRWQGEALEGRSILLRCEQGLGDSLQFFRYVRAVVDRGADVTVETHRQLLRLFAMNTSARLVETNRGGAQESYDFYCPMMSLPYAFGTRLDTIPGDVPYLVADQQQARRWSAEAAEAAGLKVGLVWAGGSRPLNPAMVSVDQRRSLHFSALECLLDIPGTVFHSLQKDAPAEQAQAAVGSGKLIDRTDELSDFADTAALIETLDLVISADTAVAHLAAAMNKPTWILSRFDGCWRWLENRDDSPWYPSVRLFRQIRPGDWDEVLARVHASLAALAAARAVQACGEVVAEEREHERG